jgi:hypothetical protein
LVCLLLKLSEVLAKSQQDDDHGVSGTIRRQNCRLDRFPFYDFSC